MENPKTELPPAFVFPKSKKAKNRFSNQMDSDELVFIEQDKGDRFFAVSIHPVTGNERNHFWVNLHHDKDWGIEF
jgi:hypothetical protein